MSGIERYKQIDLYGNLLVPVIAFFYFLIDSKNSELPIAAVIALVALGCWQLISAIVHVFIPKNLLKYQQRKIHWIAVIIYSIFGFVILTSTTDYGIIYLFSTFIITPLLAFYYIYILIQERSVEFQITSDQS